MRITNVISIRGEILNVSILYMINTAEERMWLLIRRRILNVFTSTATNTTATSLISHLQESSKYCDVTPESRNSGVRSEVDFLGNEY
jgi:hypothetical protein